MFIKGADTGALHDRLRARPTYQQAACSICGATVRGSDDEGCHTMLHDLLVVLLDGPAPRGWTVLGSLRASTADEDETGPATA